MPQVQIGIQTSFSGTGAGAAEVALGKVGATATKAERELAAYARAVAQSQRASGDSAGAIKTYESALARLNGTSKEAIAIERQLATIRKADLGPALPRTLEAFGTQAIDQFKAGILGIVGPAAVATVAIQGIGKAFELAQLGAQADLIRTRFDSLAKSSGIAGDALLAALRKGSGGEISNLNLQLAANKAQLLGVAHSAEEFGVLMSIARDRAQQLGISTTDAFDNIVTGLGRGSRLILDNIGLIVNQDDANKAYARSLGKTVAQLTVQEQKQALINQVLKDGQATLTATGGAVESAASAQARLQASTDNVKAAFGSLLANGTAPFVNSLSDLINASDGSKEGWNALINGAEVFSRQLVGLPALTAGQEQAQRDWTRSVQDWIIAREVQLGLMDAVPSGGGGGSFEFVTAKVIEGGGAYDAYAAAANAAGIATQNAATKVQFFSQAADISARSSVVDAAAKDAQQAATALVNAETKKAADAFLALNPTMDASHAFAAAVAQGLGVVTAQVIAFRIEANKAKSDLAGLATTDPNAQLKAGLSALRSGSATTANDISDANTRVMLKASADTKAAADKAAKDAEQLADVQFDNQLKKAKTNAAKIALLRQREAGTADPIERARIEGQIIDLQSQKNTGLSKELNIQESIYDSISKQKNALLDIEELTIKDRQADRDAAAKNKTAQAIIKATEGRTDQRALDFRARAQDVIALNSVEDRQRAQAIAEKQTTAGATISKTGKLLQSVPGGPVTAPSPVSGAAPVQSPIASSQAPTAGGVVVNVNIDGKTAWSGMAPYAWADLVRAAKGA